MVPILMSAVVIMRSKIALCLQFEKSYMVVSSIIFMKEPLKRIAPEKIQQLKYP